jgi:hypothetical protein
MNEESKRRLANFLGECWHEWEPAEHVTFKCKLCGKWIYEKHAWESSNRRTFTAPADFFAVFDRLVELKRWRNFIEWVCLTTEQARKGDGTELMKWLLSKTNTGEYRLCWLVGEWLTAQKEGKG